MGSCPTEAKLFPARAFHEAKSQGAEWKIEIHSAAELAWNPFCCKAIESANPAPLFQYRGFPYSSMLFSLGSNRASRLPPDLRRLRRSSLAQTKAERTAAKAGRSTWGGVGASLNIFPRLSHSKVKASD